MKPAREAAVRAALEATRQGGDAWGYRRGGGAFVEPTALALLALAPRDPPAAPVEAPAALGVLEGWQRPDGAFPAFPGDPDGSWTTSVAALALAAWGRAEASRRAVAWLDQARVPRRAIDPAARLEVRELLHIDPAIPGQAWFGATSPWVEPTCMAALARAALARTEEPAAGHCEELLRFLRDRRIQGGGWNYGNPFAFGSHLTPQVIPTAKALLALATCEGERPTESLDVLARELARAPSRLSTAWAAFAWASWGDLRAEEAADRACATPEDEEAVDALALALLAARAVSGTAPRVLPVPRTAAGGAGASPRPGSTLRAEEEP